MAVDVTNTNMKKFNTEYVVTKNAATSSVIDATEAFTITPDKQGHSIVIRMAVADSHGAVAYSVASGGFFASKGALAGSVAQATEEVIVLETAAYKGADGDIVITFTPASGKRLATDHALSVEVIELP